MPYRKTILATGEFYHIFSRSTRGLQIFKRPGEAHHFIEAMEFYLAPNPPFRFSIYRKCRGSVNIKDLIKDPLVKVIAYSLMPNHFHIALCQNKKKGIQIYIQRLLNSFSHYFNIRNQQKGPLFESPFKATRVETEEQLLHLSRYIHLQPVTGYLVEEPQDYFHSSYRAYLEKEKTFVDASIILSRFSSPKKYEEFVLARKDYQRELEKIKYLLLE